MFKPKYFYTEPYGKGHIWKVDRKFIDTKDVSATIPFRTEKLAWEFLNEISITINGTLCYKGQ
jgi:hypothetical protein